MPMTNYKDEAAMVRASWRRTATSRVEAPMATDARDRLVGEITERIERNLVVLRVHSKLDETSKAVTQDVKQLLDAVEAAQWENERLKGILRDAQDSGAVDRSWTENADLRERCAALEAAMATLLGDLRRDVVSHG